uniref:Ankyrin repeat protein n=1 Tax=Pithovirus LCPAC403 TaxID=2506596 RepID=A0A481ZCG5_9VIRU|nr:MAG: uncharacterized protein LCPAC403_03090 [Pithovirus LCPAC403]
MHTELKKNKIDLFLKSSREVNLLAMVTVKFSINREVFTVELSYLPKDSILRAMYEGDREAEIYSLSNAKFSRENVLLIIDIITKNVNKDKLKPDDVDWKGIKLLINYLCLGSYVDYIYPLFLTRGDRIDWYKSCESRHCFNKDDQLIELECKHMLDERKSDYDIIGKSTLDNPEDKYSGEPDKYLELISHIPGLFVAGGYALSKFSGYKIDYLDVDIFAYGSNSLEHIIEASKILLDINSKEERYITNVPVRSEYSISIPIKYMKFQFILIESRTPHEILNRFDLDSSCIGFMIAPDTELFCLPRFVRAFETMTNTIDPTRQSPTYIRRLIKYFNRGFEIAVPGFEKNKMTIPGNVMNAMCGSSLEVVRNQTIRKMKLRGLTALIVSAILKRNISVSVTESDYRCVASGYVYDTLRKLTEKIKPLKHISEKIPFVIEDILNQDSFSFKLPYHDDNVYTYETTVPEIRLMENDYHNEMSGSIHQIKDSFYDDYYKI